MTFRVLATLTTTLLISVGCSESRSEGAGNDPGDGGDPVVPFDPANIVDGSDPVFDAARLVSIDVTLAPADWSALGREGRSVSSAGCDGFEGTDFSYTVFPAELSIDGEAIGTVGLRKKGFLGSLMISRPSLKVDFNRFRAGLEFSGLGRLTLNNNKQDPSMLRQCVTYALFRAAGVHAPRCNFAHVTVNGTLLGTFSNVESIGRRFLRRRFADASGNLYEGQGNDFVDGRWETFQVKTNEATNDRSDLRALTEALKVEDDKLLDALAPLLDVDRFLTYWAMEALTASWDSYSTLGNNFWLYNDPNSGFEFIPWGTDATLSEGALVGGPRVQHVSTDSILSKRLYALPEIRARYFGRLRELLDTVWDVDSLLAQIDAWEALIGDGRPEDIEEIREFVRRRRMVIEAELDAESSAEPDSGDVCFLPGPEISGTFSGVWLDDPQAASTAASAAELVVDGTPIVLSDVTTRASKGLSSVVSDAPGISITGTTGDGVPIMLTIGIEEPLYASGDIPFHAISNVGFIANPASIGFADAPVAFVSDGVIRLAEAGSTDGAPVSGSFEGRLFGIRLP
jgi:hypothetical protein